MKAKEDIGKIKKGGKLPKDVGRRLLLHNREKLAVDFKDGIPILSEDEQKEYGVKVPGDGCVCSIVEAERKEKPKPPKKSKPKRKRSKRIKRRSKRKKK